MGQFLHEMDVLDQDGSGIAGGQRILVVVDRRAEVVGQRLLDVAHVTLLGDLK
jgi:hypothetical protein